MIRKIVEIDESKCIGCGDCANACLEGAIAMIDGKARLIRDDYCDGLGNCLPACPTDAIKIIEREAAEFDEEAVKKMLEERKKQEESKQHLGANTCGCPGAQARAISRAVEEEKAVKIKSQLKQWPAQIKLMPLKAAYYENADILIAADCTAYAYGNFHNDFMKNKVTIIGCPKLDDIDYSQKLSEIIKNNDIKSITLTRMEVPCCGGLEYAAKKAVEISGKDIPFKVVTVSIDGEII